MVSHFFVVVAVLLFYVVFFCLGGGAMGIMVYVKVVNNKLLDT